jgi:hypothetical protein
MLHIYKVAQKLKNKEKEKGKIKPNLEALLFSSLPPSFFGG